MKTFCRVAVLMTGLALVVGCQQPVANETKQNPQPAGRKVVIDLPLSLTPASLPSAASTAAKSALKRAPNYTSAGYAVLYEAVSMVKQFAPGAAQFGVMFDALIEQNHLTPSDETHSGLTLTFTKAMQDEIEASLPQGMLDDAALPAVGSQMPVPDFTFQASTNAHFDYTMRLSIAEGEVVMTEEVSWTADWSRFGLSLDSAGMVIVLATDSATNSTYFSMGGMGTDYKVKFRADPAAAAVHGAYVSLTSTTTFDKATMAYAVSGYGDDRGGAVTCDLSSPSGNYQFLEDFNAEGLVTYQWMGSGAVGVTNFGTADEAYSGKLANTDFGDAPNLFP